MRRAIYSELGPDLTSMEMLVLDFDKDISIALQFKNETEVLEAIKTLQNNLITDSAQ